MNPRQRPRYKSARTSQQRGNAPAHGLPGRMPLIVGSEFRLVDGTRVVLLVQDQVGYEALCSLITTGRRAAGKGCYRLTREDFTRPGLDLSGLLCLWLPTPHPDEVQADAPDEQQADALNGLRVDRMDDEAPALPESGGDRHALERAAWVRRGICWRWRSRRG